MPPRVHPLIEAPVLEDLYFQQRLSLPRIAERLGVPYSLVRASMRAAGLQWRTKSEARTGRPWDEATKAKIAAAHQGLKDTPETAARKREILASHCGWSKGLTAETDGRVARMRDAVGAYMRQPAVRDAVSKLRVQQIQAGGFWDRGYHESPKVGPVYYMSGWEQRRWQELDADPQVVTYQRSPCAVLYDWDGSVHRYVPDVLIHYDDGSKVLEEIKPLSLLVKPHKGQAKLLAKVQAGAEYAATQGWGWRIFSYPSRVSG